MECLKIRTPMSALLHLASLWPFRKTLVNGMLVSLTVYTIVIYKCGYLTCLTDAYNSVNIILLPILMHVLNNACSILINHKVMLTKLLLASSISARMCRNKRLRYRDLMMAMIPALHGCRRDVVFGGSKTSLMLDSSVAA